MSKPVVRLAMAATVVGAVALGLFERIVPCQSGVVRAEEKKDEKKKKQEKEKEVGLGFTCRQRQTQTQPGAPKPIETTITIRHSPQYGFRIDTHYQGKTGMSKYFDYAEGTTVTFFHTGKIYTRSTGPKGPRPVEQTYDPRPRLKKALAAEHKKLGRRMIEGVEAEGIEVPLHGVMGASNTQAPIAVDSAVARFWSSVETGCPILVEETMVALNGAVRVNTIRDQFRWNVRFDPNEFKAEIPADYQLVDEQQLRRGGLGGFGQRSMSGPAGTPRSGRKARR